MGLRSVVYLSACNCKISRSSVFDLQIKCFFATFHLLDSTSVKILGLIMSFSKCGKLMFFSKRDSRSSCWSSSTARSKYRQNSLHFFHCFARLHSQPKQRPLNGKFYNRLDVLEHDMEEGKTVDEEECKVLNWMNIVFANQLECCLCCLHCTTRSIGPTLVV